MRMKYAIISDIHSNLEALERALEEIQKRGCGQIICLGDVVGYGADPSQCLKLVQESAVYDERFAAKEIIMGNHDRAVEDVKLRESFNDWAKVAIEWTAGVLNDKEKAVIRTFAPIVIDSKEDITWTHGSVHETGEFHYLFDTAEAEKSFQKLKTRFCFFGHTHIPSIFSEKSNEVQYLSAGTYQLSGTDRFLINLGSVGQPRDRNPELSFAFFDSKKFSLEIVRLDYDNQKAAEKIRKAGLPSFLADRLL